MSEKPDRHGMGGNNPPERTLSETLAEEFSEHLAAVDAYEKQFKKLPKSVRSDATVQKYADFASELNSLKKKLEAARCEVADPYHKSWKQANAFFKAPKDRIDAFLTDMTTRADKFMEAKEESERLKRAKAANDAQAAEDERLARARALEHDGQALQAEIVEKAADKAGGQADTDAGAALEGKAADFTRTKSDAGNVATSRTEWTFDIADHDKVDLEPLRPFIKPEHIEMAVRQFVKINKNKKTLGGVRIYQKNKTQFR